MPRRSKPKISPPAKAHQARGNELIVEFSAGNSSDSQKSGLISLRDEDKILVIDLYLLSGLIDVKVPMKHLVRNPDVAQLITALHLAQTVFADVRAVGTKSDFDLARRTIDEAMKHFGDVLETVVAEERIALAAKSAAQ